MRPPPNSDSHRTSEVRTTIRQSYNNMKDSCAVIISRRGRTKAKEDISRAPCNPDVASDATTSQNPAVASPSPVAMRPMVTSYALPDIGGMHQFEHDVDNAIMSRFNLVRSKLSPELAKHLNDRVRGYSKTNQFLCLHPALLGHNETDANVKIVVYCEECAMEEASLFFAQEWICALYKASEECPIGFEVVVEGPLRGLFGWLAAEVRIDNWHPDSPSSRIFVTQADKTRFATMGGVLLVRNHDGTDRFYGLTVQHVLSPRQEDEPNKDNIDDALSKGQEYDINTKSKIGVITASNSKQQYRKFDWALVELMQAFSSSVVTEQAPGTAPFWEVARPQPGIPVCLNNSPDIQGVFARWPGHAILPYSDTFVEVHMIRPSNADSKHTYL